jgi:hypothetical protein
MAKVWFAYEGREPTLGNAAYELPAKEAIEKLAVTSDAILPERPRFNPDSKLGRIAGYQHVVLELDESDAASTGWATGYYLVSASPDEVTGVLGPPRGPFPAE